MSEFMHSVLVLRLSLIVIGWGVKKLHIFKIYSWIGWGVKKFNIFQVLHIIGRYD